MVFIEGRPHVKGGLYEGFHCIFEVCVIPFECEVMMYFYPPPLSLVYYSLLQHVLCLLWLDGG